MEPKKALTLSFHGWTGGGKNFVSKMIAEHLFKDGMDSQFVHMFLSTLHFPHRHKIMIYQDNLVQWIRGNISKCDTSLFIFDEMDKMPPGLLDSIKSFLDYHASIDGHSFNKAIFIFISNTVGIQLTKVAINFWKQGKDRTDITLKDVNKILIDGAFNEISGLQYSSIIQNNLIDFFVPFLPLEKFHIELCARDEIKHRRGVATAKLLTEVADSLLYYPPNSLLYSTSGCKQVAKKLDLLIDDEL
uniref:Torsin-1A C-terminal domain-containing protein n=1 Tax=Strigamia maritima TaxID=126957 RepID=T1JCD4_STRMM